MSWPPLLAVFKMTFLSMRKNEQLSLVWCVFFSFSLRSLFSSDLHVSERQAQALANYVRANGTSILRQARNLFLWHNLTNSVLVKKHPTISFFPFLIGFFQFGLVLFVCFYVGLSMNALTFALVGLIFLFTVPKVYQVYQVESVLLGKIFTIDSLILGTHRSCCQTTSRSSQSNYSQVNRKQTILLNLFLSPSFVESPPNPRKLK